jgi:oligo-1,6-glucosidase
MAIVASSLREKKWWKEEVVYQIYPASFCDSDGDGMGDFMGIKFHLTYLHSTGVRVIWICPMYRSPQVDMGYDVSDYQDTHLPYGSLDQMEELIRAAHGLGMSVILDLVINHTSDQHDWFLESRATKFNPKRDWYIWRPAKYDEQGNRQPPNNWRSNFGSGSAWEWDEATGEYYLHLFAKEQPDLNWENPETRAAIYDSSMHFWLKRGVNGFRVDTVNMYSKPPGLPDAPVVDPSSPYQPAGLVYCNGPRMHEFLGEMNEILRPYDAITVGELPHTPDMDTVVRYVSAEARLLNMVLLFEAVDIGKGKVTSYDTEPGNWTLLDLKAAISHSQYLLRGTDAWTTVFLENHDQARSVSRFGDDSPLYREASAKMLAMMQTCLSGTLFIYQGQELGCINAPLSRYPVDQYLDIQSIQHLDKVRAEGGDMARAEAALEYLARDHSRIPMAWDGGLEYGGFSYPAQKSKDKKEISPPWMAPHPYSSEINMRAQLHDPESVHNFWRHMLRFRKEYADALIYGDYKTLRPDNASIFMYTKTSQSGDLKMLVVLNFTKFDSKLRIAAEEVGLPEGSHFYLQPLVSTHLNTKTMDRYEATVPLTPFEGRVFMVNT